MFIKSWNGMAVTEQLKELWLFRWICGFFFFTHGTAKGEGFTKGPCCLYAGHTTGNIWAPKYYLFPLNDLPHRPPSKKSEKSGKKFQAKVIQGHVPWLNLKKNFQISFSQYAKSVGTPLFRSMLQAQNTDTHALNQLGVSQNSSPLWSNFTADKHIWHPPWAWM